MGCALLDESVKDHSKSFVGLVFLDLLVGELTHGLNHALLHLFIYTFIDVFLFLLLSNIVYDLLVVRVSLVIRGVSPALLSGTSCGGSSL